MNMITVIARGAPNSFARAVQVDPDIAVELLHVVQAMVEWFDRENTVAARQRCEDMARNALNALKRQELIA